MNKRIAILAIILVLSIFPCLELSCPEAASRTVIVGVYENAPKVFISESGKPSGIFIDIIENIAKSEGWDLRYVSGTWAEGLDRLAQGGIDLMPDVAYTAEREKQYSFHKIPVLSVWSQVYARSGSGIQSILDLNGKRVVALEQTIQLETFKRLTRSFELKITLIPVSDYKTEFEMIAGGKADAGVTNRFYGLMYARKFGLEDTPIMFDPAPFFFAAAKGDPKQLLKTIDNRLSELKRDSKSVYYASLNQWTSEEVRFKLPLWLKMLGLALSIVLFMSLTGSFYLRHLVNVRTGEMRNNEQRYRQLFERNPAPMLIYQRGTLQMLAVNDAFTDHYGYSTEKALSLHLPDLYPEEEKSLITELAAGLKGHAYAGEWHHLKADGSMITIVARSHDIEYWGRDARIAVLTDITDRKKAEEQLRHSEEKFFKAFNATPDSIVISRASDGLLVEVNDVFLRESGYSREEALGSSTLSLDLWAVSLERERYVAAVKSQGRVRDMEARFRTKSGMILDGLVSGETVVLGDDLCLLTIIRDITMRKKTEQELEKHRLHLEELVNERTAELKAKIAEIERMNKLFVDRELRMIELKATIKKLESGSA